MDIREVRRANLRYLAKDLGSISALATFLGKSQAQISQLIGRHPTKNIGDHIAREVEEKFGKSMGWMDYLDLDEHGRPQLSQAQEELYLAITELSESQIRAVTDFIINFTADLQRKAGPAVPHPRKKAQVKKATVRKFPKKA